MLMVTPLYIIAENLNAHLEIHPNDMVGENQKTEFKQYLLCDQSSGFPVKYCYDVVEDYHEKLMKSLK